MLTRSLVVAAALLTSACDLAALSAQFASSCAYTSDRETTVSAAGVSRVRVVARSGWLRIQGQSDTTDLRAFGPACAVREADLAGIELVAERVGDELIIEARFSEAASNGGRLDLTVEVPDALPLEIDDSSGSIQIADVAGVTLSDRSGSILLENASGDVRIVDGSGSLTVRDVDGTVTVANDGSGSIKIEEVTGDVVIEEDGSGSITVNDVDGDFRVERDGSGSIRSDRIGGRTVTE